MSNNATHSRGGTIFVGISDRRPCQILGVAWGQNLVEQVQEAARSTQPPPQLEADAKLALVFARRMGTITNEQLRRLRPLDREASRETLQDLVARGLLEAFGRGQGTGYRLSALAMEAQSTATLGEQLFAVLNHARRSGVVVNAEVRGLLGVGAQRLARSSRPSSCVGCSSPKASGVVAAT